MELPPFLLDRWIEQKHTADPPIEFDLASSTGPVWTLRELLWLSGGRDIEGLLETRVSYTSAAGSPELRKAIAKLEEADAEEVQVVTGASEALLILFFLAAEPGANVILPNPGFPANAALAESLGISIRYYSLCAERHFRPDLDEIRRMRGGKAHHPSPTSHRRFTTCSSAISRRLPPLRNTRRSVSRARTRIGYALNNRASG